MRRNAFSLIEVLLALAIGVVLLGALYAALNLQIRGMNSGRNLLEQAAVVRSLFNRLGGDIGGSINLVDPARFRNLAAAAEAAAAAAPMTTTPMTTTPMTTTPMTTTPMTGTTTPTTGTTTTTPEDGDTTGSGSESINGVPLGVMGDASSLHLFASKVPTEAYTGQLVGDVRRISYWLAKDKGLCRAEAKLVLTADALEPSIPTGDEADFLIAPEVSDVAFSYFDGTGWQDSWDSSQIGPDNATPIGPPRAIAIKLSVRPPAVGGATPEPKTFRHVVHVATANGQALNPGGGTTP